MSDVTLADAKAQLSELIERVLRGEEVTITRRGKPVARLVGIERKPKPIDFEALRALRESLPQETESVGVLDKDDARQCALLMLYLDTSLLVSALSNEPRSAIANDWLAKQVASQLVISDWAITEFSSALSLKLRMGIIDAAQRGAILTQFTQLAANTLRDPAHRGVSLPGSGPVLRSGAPQSARR